MNEVIRGRIDALRSEMADRGIDMYLIGSSDFHGSEYVDGYFQCREWISGFTGSAGTLVVSPDYAGLWTDGRYFLQASQQLSGTGIELVKMGNEGVPLVEDYIVDHLGPGQCLGFDGRTIGARMGQGLARRLAEKGASVEGRYDLVGDIWTDRPPLSQEPAWLLDVAYAGKSREEKIALIRSEMVRKNADWLVITSLDDIGWLLNIRGNDVEDNPVLLSYLMMSLDCVRLYANPGAFSVDDLMTLDKAGIELYAYNDIYDDVAALTGGVTIWYDGSALNYSIVERIPKNAKVIDEMNPTRIPKAKKNPTELEWMRKAHIKDGVALTKFMYWLKTHVGKEPMTEMSASDKLEEFRKAQGGYLMPSFDPISGYGPDGAIIHYSATKETNADIEAKGLLLMDTGAQYTDGTTDMTRTYALGELTDEEKEMYTLVLKGHLALSDAKFLYGCKGSNLDYLAREPLWRKNMDYNHGTGHGIGFLLNVHEGPNSFRWKWMPNRPDDTVLEEGMITSNEPGVYLEGKFGVRIENLIVCRKGEKNEYGQFMYFETLTLTPYDLDAIDVSMLTEHEKELINDYHRRVREVIGPELDDDERAWLEYATRAV